MNVFQYYADIELHDWDKQINFGFVGIDLNDKQKFIDNMIILASKYHDECVEANKKRIQQDVSIIRHNKKLYDKYCKPNKDVCYFCGQVPNGCKTYNYEDSLYILCNQCAKYSKEMLTDSDFNRETK